MDTHTLLIDCPDEKGLISRITDVLYKNDLNIIVNREFVDHETSHFFMRTVFSGPSEAGFVKKQLQEVLPRNASIYLTGKEKKNILVFATKEHHVLGDLLIRNEFDELNADIQAVISNHQRLELLVKKFDLPYHFVSHEEKDRKQHEREILKFVTSYDPDYIILAKYMRILTPEFVDRFLNRILNIHHSFLPAFAGAQPYRQAHDRGVKVIGATAHYVNENLDDGPIIAQSTTPVDHSFDVDKLTQAGREIESRVLASALHLVVEDKVFVHGNKTVILD